MKDAVVVIDMVNDFVTGKFANPRAEKIIPDFKNLIDKAHEKNIPVIYVSDAHLPHDPELKIWGEHCMKGTWGAEVISDLSPQKQDYSLEKRTYCAFFQTGLDSLLRELGVKNIILGGVVTNICLINSAAAGFFNGYQVITSSAITDAINQDLRDQSLKYIQDNYNGEVISLDEIEKRW
nr:isochorismatase family cysteine hydrolase [uncultured Ligilactobacillus sp.]